MFCSIWLRSFVSWLFASLLQGRDGKRENGKQSSDYQEGNVYIVRQQDRMKQTEPNKINSCYSKGKSCGEMSFFP